MLPLKQPPSRGCVLKQLMGKTRQEQEQQPPSRGCVLKQIIAILLKN